MPITDVGIITKLLNAFLFVLSGGYGRTLPEALWILEKMVILELFVVVILWIATEKEVLLDLIMKTIWFGFLVFLLKSWPALSVGIVKSFIQVGLLIGGDAIELKDFLNPSIIMSHGMAVLSVIVLRMSTYSGWFSALNLFQMFMYGIASLIIFFSFLVITAQIFIKILEFYIAANVVLILLPFGAFRHTMFLAEKAFAVVIGSAISLCVLALVTSVALPFLKTVQLTATSGIPEAFSVAAAAFIVAILAWNAPGIASGILMGSPALSASNVAGAALVGAQMAFVGGLAGSKLGSALLSGTQKATQAGAALVTAGREGGGSGLRMLAQQAGRDLSSATMGHYARPASSGATYAREAMTYTPTGTGGGSSPGANAGRGRGSSS